MELLTNYNVVGVGVDDHMARKMANLIVSTSIDVTGIMHESGYEKPGYDDWEEPDFYEYGRWLGTLLSYAEVQSDDYRTGPTVGHFRRATKMRLGPSPDVIVRKLGLKDFSEYKSNLGHRVQSEFAHLPKRDLVQQTRRLAGKMDRRPDTKDIARWHAKGLTPSEATFKRTFGSLARWQELIGFWPMRPESEDDVVDWGAAFYHSFPEEEITTTLLRRLQVSGRGPSIGYVYNNGGLDALRQKSKKRYHENIELWQQSRDTVSKRMKYDMDTGGLPVEFEPLVQGSADIAEETLRAYAIYWLVSSFDGVLSKHKAAAVSIADGPNVEGHAGFEGYAVYTLKRYSPSISDADIEHRAAALGIYDAIWPLYRFQNIDFRWTKVKRTK